MNLKMILLFLFSSALFTTISAKDELIEIKEGYIYLQHHFFNITEVIDLRAEKNSIGYTRTGSENKMSFANFNESISTEFQTFFNENFNRSKSKIDVQLVVHSFIISEHGLNGNEDCILDWKLEFKIKEKSVFVYEEQQLRKVVNAETYHGKNIRNGLESAIRAFALELSKLPTKKSARAETDTNQLIIPKHNKDLISIGLNIGGLTRVGVNYEKRISNTFGVHAGVGLLGYNAGFRIHASELKRSTYVDISWKDYGFGYVSGIGLDIGKPARFLKKSDLSFLLKFGLLYVTKSVYNPNTLRDPVRENSMLLIVGIGLAI